MVGLFSKKKSEFLEPGKRYPTVGVPGPASDFGQTQAKAPGVLEEPLGGLPSPSVSSEHLESISKNIELVSSKLDALKSSLDYLNQRIANLEASIKQQSAQQQPAQQQGNILPSFGGQQQQQTQEEQGWHY